MKKNMLNWMTIMLMAFVCVSFSACSSDDDDNGGGSGSASSSGVTVNVKNGYFFKDDLYWCLQFANYTPSNQSGNLEKVEIYLRIESATIPEGEFTTNFEVEICKYNSATKKEIIWGNGIPSQTTGKVSIKKDGDTYSVSYTGVTLYELDEDDNKKPVNTINNCSFSYTGTLTNIPYGLDMDSDDDDDK